MAAPAPTNIRLGDTYNFRNVYFDTDYAFNYVEASINNGPFGQVYNGGIHEFSTYGLPGGSALTSSDTFDLVFRLVSSANGPSDDAHVTLTGSGWTPLPTITAVDKDHGVTPGDVLTITGTGFGTIVANSGGVIFTDTFAPPESTQANLAGTNLVVLSDTTLQITVPDGLHTTPLDISDQYRGQVRVFNNGGSNPWPLYFTNSALPDPGATRFSYGLRLPDGEPNTVIGDHIAVSIYVDGALHSTTQTDASGNIVDDTVPHASQVSLHLHDLLGRFPDQWVMGVANTVDQAKATQWTTGDGQTSMTAGGTMKPANRLDRLPVEFYASPEAAAGTVCDILRNGVVVATQTLVSPGNYFSNFTIIGESFSGPWDVPTLPYGDYTVRWTEPGGRTTSYEVNTNSIDLTASWPPPAIGHRPNGSSWALDGRNPALRATKTPAQWVVEDMFGPSENRWPGPLHEVGTDPSTTITGPGTYHVVFQDGTPDFPQSWRQFVFIPEVSGTFIAHTRQPSTNVDPDTQLFFGTEPGDPYQVSYTASSDDAGYTDGLPDVSVLTPEEHQDLVDGLWSWIKVDVVAGQQYILSLSPLDIGTAMDLNLYVTLYPGQQTEGALDLTLSAALKAALAAPENGDGALDPLPGFPGLSYTKYYDQTGDVQGGYPVARVWVQNTADINGDIAPMDSAAFSSLLASPGGEELQFWVKDDTNSGDWLAQGYHSSTTYPSPADADGKMIDRGVALADWGPLDDSGASWWHSDPAGHPPPASYDWNHLVTLLGGSGGGRRHRRSQRQLELIGFNSRQAEHLQSADLSLPTIRELQMVHGYTYRQALTLKAGVSDLRGLIRGGFSPRLAKEI